MSRPAPHLATHLFPHENPDDVRPAVSAYVHQNSGSMPPDQILALIEAIIAAGGPLLSFILSHWGPKPVPPPNPVPAS